MVHHILYLLQVSVCLGLFYGLYIIFLKNTTFFLANRIYLLAGLVLSFVIPVLQLSWVEADHHLWSTDHITTAALTAPDRDPVESSAEPEKLFDLSVLLFIIYSTGAGVTMARLLYAIIRILNLKNHSTIYRKDKVKMVQTDLTHPFSFFNLIFLPKQEISPLIIEHEKAHIRQLHWIDLLMVEAASIMLWFNPMMILYKRSIKTQHEYQADACTIEGGVPVEHYLDCMLGYIQVENAAGPVSQFHSKTIKNRILMMTKNKTSRKFSAVYLLLIPVISMLLFAFSNQPAPAPSPGNNASPVKDGQPIVVVDAGHGGNDTGARAGDGTSEKEFVLSIARKIQKAGEEKGIKVILTRTGDEALTLEERTTLVSRFAADLFISLHVNDNPQNGSASGMECIVSERNIQFNESKRFAQQLVNELKTLRGIAVNGIKKSDPYVLKNNSLPAVILELGYLSNKADDAYIREDKNQREISERIITSVILYTK